MVRLSPSRRSPSGCPRPRRRGPDRDSSSPQSLEPSNVRAPSPSLRGRTVRARSRVRQLSSRRNSSIAQSSSPGDGRGWESPEVVDLVCIFRWSEGFRATIPFPIPSCSHASLTEQIRNNLPFFQQAVPLRVRPADTSSVPLPRGKFVCPLSGVRVGGCFTCRPGMEIGSAGNRFSSRDLAESGSSGPAVPLRSGRAFGSVPRSHFPGFGSPWR